MQGHLLREALCQPFSMVLFIPKQRPPLINSRATTTTLLASEELAVFVSFAGLYH